MQASIHNMMAKADMRPGGNQSGSMRNCFGRNAYRGKGFLGGRVDFFPQDTPENGTGAAVNREAGQSPAAREVSRRRSATPWIVPPGRSTTIEWASPWMPPKRTV